MLLLIQSVYLVVTICLFQFRGLLSEQLLLVIDYYYYDDDQLSWHCKMMMVECGYIACMQRWLVVGKMPFRVKTTLVGFWDGYFYFTSGQRDKGPDNPSPKKVIGDVWRTQLSLQQYFYVYSIVTNCLTSDDLISLQPILSFSKSVWLILLETFCGRYIINDCFEMRFSILFILYCISLNYDTHYHQYNKDTS